MSLRETPGRLPGDSRETPRRFPDATHGAIDRATHAAIDRATHAANDRATHGAIDRATHGAIDRATHGAIDCATMEPSIARVVRLLIVFMFVHRAIDRSPRTVPSIARHARCHRSRATRHARPTTDTRTRSRFPGFATTLSLSLSLPLASPIIIITSSSRRRRRRRSSSSSISRLYGVALSWAILSLTTPKLRLYDTII